jgi:sugar/nucleoside kinase (ribokinase family)
MKTYDVIGIGSALLDITFEVDDSLIKELGLNKGQMVLIDNEKNKEILKKLYLYSSETFPGGSSANTIAGVGVLGGNSLFISKIGNDVYGEIYEKKTKDYNVVPDLKKHTSQMTGNTITFITPDLERTFATNLGASLDLNKLDLDEELLKKAKILHLEGYFVPDNNLKVVLFHALDLAKKNNLKISMDLCDQKIIRNNLELLKEILKEYIDIVFANESEAEEFTGKKGIEALNELSKYCEIAIVKLGEKGSLIKYKDEIFDIPSYKANVVNTNGAGDMYAAGILYGLTNGLDIKSSGKLASFASSLVVKSKGARIDDDLREELTFFLNSLKESD